VLPSPVLLGFAENALEPKTKSCQSSRLDFRFEAICLFSTSLSVCSFSMELITPEKKRFWRANPTTTSSLVIGKCLLYSLFGFIAAQ